MTEHVKTEVQDGILTIRLARPEKKNALTQAMYTAIADALDRANTEDAIRVVAIHGAPGVFTAGNDIGDFLANPPRGDEAPVFRFLKALVALDRPLVAAVDGPAVGVGTTLLLHADFVLATPEARFAMPFVNLGLVPEAASSFLLPRLVGLARASEWLMLGEPFDGAAAREAGLVTRIVAREALETEARTIAEKLAAKPREALRLTKRLLREPERARVREVMDHEGALFTERLASDEAREAFMAFMSRR